jgi:hypothetical protein
MDYMNLKAKCGNECLIAAIETLKWIFCFLPFMVHGFMKSVKLFISFVNNLKPVEIFN